MQKERTSSQPTVGIGLFPSQLQLLAYSWSQTACISSSTHLSVCSTFEERGDRSIFDTFLVWHTGAVMFLSGAPGLVDLSGRHKSWCSHHGGGRGGCSHCQILLRAAECKQQMAELVPERHVKSNHSVFSSTCGYSRNLSSRGHQWNNLCFSEGSGFFYEPMIYHSLVYGLWSAVPSSFQPLPWHPIKQKCPQQIPSIKKSRPPCLHGTYILWPFIKPYRLQCATDSTPTELSSYRL